MDWVVRAKKEARIGEEEEEFFSLQEMNQLQCQFVSCIRKNNVAKLSF